MIPKTIYTCWFPNKETMPKKIQECVNSQNIDGYDFRLLTIDNIIKDHPYINQCINSKFLNKKWVKLKDFLQLYYLYHFGGWFLDADVRILDGKNFDKYSDEDFVIGIEGEGTIPNSIIVGAAVIGASKHNPILREIIEKVVSNFRGDDDKCFESSLDIITPICLNNQDKVKFTDPEVFYPYDHNTNITNITDNTISMHLFTKSWILPTVSIIIPHLDLGIEARKKGLEDLIESIKSLNYPQALIDYIVIDGDKTVPEKLQIGVNKTKGEYIVYAANDMTFHTDCIRNAVEHSNKNNKALVSFNEGELLPDKGNICTHFLIKRDFIPFVGGNIFNTELRHVGVDNLLWSMADKQGQASWCESAKITHKHFSKGFVYDDVYKKGWSYINSDRNKLEELMNK